MSLSQLDILNEVAADAGIDLQEFLDEQASYALIQLQVSETISVGEVTLHSSKEQAEAAGVTKYGEYEEDDYGRHSTDDGDPVYQVRPVTRL